ncbi:MAG: acetate kinase [Fibrobacter sp.]|nr:acetate kinase [Fibrobacter sp.]
MSNVLVINSGSSSLKFAVIDPLTEKFFATGLVENIGGEAHLVVKMEGDKVDEITAVPNHQVALELTVKVLEEKKLLENGLKVVGHRVVHGGEFFSDSVIINSKVKTAIESCNELAPLHNPANLEGIEVAQKLFKGVPQVAVFDTAFHQTLPDYAYMYGLPKELYEKKGVRRYGFHGTSHRFVTLQAAKLLGKTRPEVNLVTAHLGNGSSITAVLNGYSVDTTMGLTPMEGIPMGTRSGTIDPGIFMYLHRQMGWTVSEINEVLNKKSGFLGLSGISNDMRTLSEAAVAGNAQASLTIEVFCWSLAKAIASMAVALPSIDALVFTGGIGENSALIREKTLAHLKILNFEVDSGLNLMHGKKEKGIITKEGSTRAMVIPTNEELLIAQDAMNLVS